jgi:hypothetical protein
MLFPPSGLVYLQLLCSTIFDSYSSSYTVARL